MLVETYKDQNAPASSLLFAFIKQFGTEGLEWDPQLIRKEIDDYNTIELSDLNSDKLNAAIEVLTSNMFEENWNVFETCCHLFANVPVDSSIVVPLDVEEIIKGIAEAHLIKHEPLEYNADINIYVGKVFFDYGFSKPPDLFSSAIMPEGNESDDKTRNESLKELFDFCIKNSINYLERISE